MVQKNQRRKNSNYNIIARDFEMNSKRAVNG